MDDRATGPFDRLEGALDQLLPRLGEHGDRHVVRYEALLDQRAHEVEPGLRLDAHDGGAVVGQDLRAIREFGPKSVTS